MQLKSKAVLCSILALASLPLVIFGIFHSPVFAQERGPKKERKAADRKEGRTAVGRGELDEESAVDGPIDLKKFPGTGSIDAWKESVPEYRSGLLKMKEHKWDEAIAHFKASIALYEFQPRAWLQIGRATEAKDGLVADAEQAYRRSLKLNSQNWNAWKCLANNLYVQKRFSEAREAAANGVQLSPPPRGRQELDKMIQVIDSGQKDANTESQNSSLR